MTEVFALFLKGVWGFTWDGRGDCYKIPCDPEAWQNFLDPFANFYGFWLHTAKNTLRPKNNPILRHSSFHKEGGPNIDPKVLQPLLEGSSYKPRYKGDPQKGPPILGNPHITLVARFGSQFPRNFPCSFPFVPPLMGAILLLLLLLLLLVRVLVHC